MKQLVLLLGGTFDPVHNGHLRIAQHVLDATQSTILYFVPCYLPPHRSRVIATAVQRMEMLRLALEDTSFAVNDCEMRRAGVSWTKDTVCAERKRLGEEYSLCLVLGMDVYEGFASWHEWQEIMNQAHLIVCARDGASAEIGNKRLDATLVSDINALRTSSAGLVCHLPMPQYPESSSTIRAELAAGHIPTDYLPLKVSEYINAHDLYRKPPVYEKA